MWPHHFKLEYEGKQESRQEGGQEGWQKGGWDGWQEGRLEGRQVGSYRRWHVQTKIG